MPLDLPTPLPAYFAAKNNFDIGGTLATFAPDAIVDDEHEQHVGREEIRAWMEAATRKYRDTAEPVTLESDGDTHRVDALVSGNFPGSPATLHFRFRLQDALIANLDIGA